MMTHCPACLLHAPSLWCSPRERRHQITFLNVIWSRSMSAEMIVQTSPCPLFVKVCGKGRNSAQNQRAFFGTDSLFLPYLLSLGTGSHSHFLCIIQVWMHYCCVMGKAAGRGSKLSRQSVSSVAETSFLFTSSTPSFAMQQPGLLQEERKSNADLICVEMVILCQRQQAFSVCLCTCCASEFNVTHLNMKTMPKLRLLAVGFSSETPDRTPQSRGRVVSCVHGSSLSCD